MPRPRSGPSTALGVALIERRGTQSLMAVSELSGVNYMTLSRLEREARRPSYDNAKALAVWLGWTVEAVMEAAEKGVEGG